MKRTLLVLLLALTGAVLLYARQTPERDDKPAPDDAPGLTIYNQNFAVVRHTLPLDLHAGINTVQFTGATARLEPDSVMLRDPLNQRRLQVYEQNYRNDPVSQELLLSLYEGKVLDFRVLRDGQERIVQGKLIRSGYAPRFVPIYNDPYAQNYANQGSMPIVEVDGKIQFGLPGQPLFPSLTGDTILKPTLHWLLATDKPGQFDAEISYVTGGFSWEADYNVVAPEEGNVLDIVGWVTMQNQSGKVFERARIKLLAGDVNKLLPGAVAAGMMARKAMAMEARDAMQPAVTSRSFDEYHLYTLQRPVTLRDRETKQVEFVRSTQVRSQRLYVYDGAQIDWNRYQGWNYENIRNDHSYGTISNPKVWVMQELRNSEANHMGITLPRGRMRFYRRDEDGRLQFTGENFIDHTPKDETIRLYTGNSFDLVGERRRVDYRVNSTQDWADESFEIKLRNHKKTAVEIRVVEHLYRCDNWRLTTKSHPYRKLDSHTIEFPVTVPPNGEVTVSYLAHYTW